MKLSAIRWIVTGVGALFVATLLLDLAGIVNVPVIYMLLCGLSLVIAAAWVEKAQRRRS